MTTTTLPPRPTPEQITRWPSCRIAAALHDLHAALAASNSTMAQIQLRQAIASTRRAWRAQVDAEAEDGRELGLTDEPDSERTEFFLIPTLPRNSVSTISIHNDPPTHHPLALARPLTKNERAGLRRRLSGPHHPQSASTQSRGSDPMSTESKAVALIDRRPASVMVCAVANDMKPKKPAGVAMVAPLSDCTRLDAEGSQAGAERKEDGIGAPPRSSKESVSGKDRYTSPAKSPTKKNLTKFPKPMKLTNETNLQ